jgi:hypothetical protein
MFDCLCMLDMHALSLATSNRMLTLWGKHDQE